MSPWIADAFRAYWGASPFLAAAAAVCIAFAPQVGLPRARQDSGNWWALGTAAILAAAGAHMLLYLWTPNYIDYAEPLIAVIGSNLMNGDALYHNVHDGQSMVSSLYGPLVFLVQVLALAASPTVFSSKLPGVVAALTTMALLGLALRRAAPDERGLPWLGLAALVVFLYPFRHFWFWNRPDPLLLLVVSASVLAFATLRPAAALLVMGCLGAAAANLKLHAPLYLFPLAVTATWRLSSWSSRAATCTGAGILFLAVFLLPFQLPQIDLKIYLNNLATISRHGLSGYLIVESVAYAVIYLALPAALLARAPARAAADVWLFWSLATASIVMAVVSGKPGSGVSHMFPFLPIALFLTARLIASARTVPFLAVGTLRALVLAGLTIFLPIWGYSVYEIHKHYPDFTLQREEAAEARALFARYAGAEMASVQDVWDSTTFHRVQGGFAGRIQRFDVVNWMDMRLAGLPADVVRHFVEDCRVPTWIAPKRKVLFEALGFGQTLFDEEFRIIFASNYRLAEDGRFFNVWTCVEPKDTPRPVSSLSAAR